MPTPSGPVTFPGANHLFAFGTIIAVGVGLSALVEWKVRSDTQAAIDRFRDVSGKELHHEAEEMATDFKQVYQGLRTISFLPSIKSIDRHGKTIDGNARESIIQIYNNLRTNVTVSEVYIVPATLDPEKIDPETGSLEMPILMFDDAVAAHEDGGDIARERQVASADVSRAVEDFQNNVTRIIHSASAQKTVFGQR